MRKYTRTSQYYGSLVLILVLFAVSCSLIPSFDKSQPQPTPTPSPKPVQPQPQPQPTPTPSPEPVQPQPQPQPTPTPSPEPVQPEPPDVQKIIQTGIVQFEAGDINEAIASFEKATQLDPNNTQAAEYLQQARDEKDRLIQMHLNKGIKYFTEESLEDAMLEWEKVLALDPSHQKGLEYKELTETMLNALKEGQ